jgi:hypothetical protein
MKIQNPNYEQNVKANFDVDLQAAKDADLLWCNETLEAHTVNQCSAYPASNPTALRAISIQTGNARSPLNWTPVNAVSNCGQHIVAVRTLEPTAEWGFTTARLHHTGIFFHSEVP